MTKQKTAKLDLNARRLGQGGYLRGRGGWFCEQEKLGRHLDQLSRGLWFRDRRAIPPYALKVENDGFFNEGADLFPGLSSSYTARQVGNVCPKACGAFFDDYRILGHVTT